jgi:hypothetical protein
MAQEDFDQLEGERRGRTKNRRPRNKRRSSSEKGKCYTLGNGMRGFCSYCRPTLMNRLHRREHIKGEILDYFNEHIK